MAFLTLTDFNDNALKGLVDAQYLSQVDEYINNLAAMRGVDVSDIASPLAYLARQLAIAWCYKTVAREKSGINPQAYANGVEVDIYAMKFKQWNHEYERLEPLVTAEVLTGDADTPGEFSYSIPVFRG